jgi:hypothetical protein
MKRFMFFALPLAGALGLAALASGNQASEPAGSCCSKTKSGCACEGCKCPSCNGEICTCETCECTACGCLKS